MKTLLRLLPIALAFWAGSSSAQTVTATARFSDTLGNLQTNCLVTLLPKGPLVGYNGYILSAVPNYQVTDTNGTVVFTNVVSGYSYWLSLNTPYAVFTNMMGLPNGLTGSINALNYLGTNFGLAFAFYQPTNLFLAGTGITLTTNGYTVTISANGTGQTTNTFDITQFTSPTNLSLISGMNVTNPSVVGKANIDNLNVTNGSVFGSGITNSTLTATKPVTTDANKKLISSGLTPPAANFSVTDPLTFAWIAGSILPSLNGTNLTNIVGGFTLGTTNITVIDTNVVILSGSSASGGSTNVNQSYSYDSPNNQFTNSVNGVVITNDTIGSMRLLTSAGGPYLFRCTPISPASAGAAGDHGAFPYGLWTVRALGGTTTIPTGVYGIKTITLNVYFQSPAAATNGWTVFTPGISAQSIISGVNVNDQSINFNNAGNQPLGNILSSQIVTNAGYQSVILASSSISNYANAALFGACGNMFVGPAGTDCAFLGVENYFVSNQNGAMLAGAVIGATNHGNTMYVDFAGASHFIDTNTVYFGRIGGQFTYDNVNGGFSSGSYTTNQGTESYLIGPSNNVQNVTNGVTLGINNIVNGATNFALVGVNLTQPASGAYTGAWSMFGINGANLTATNGVIGITGSLSGNGSGLTQLNGSQVTSGTVPAAQLGSGTANNTKFLRGDSTWQAFTSGTVTSVAMTGDGTVFSSSVTGSPITTSGTLVPSLANQTSNTFLAGPKNAVAAAPTFRGLDTTDFGPLLSATFSNSTASRFISYTNGTAPTITTNGSIPLGTSIFFTNVSPSDQRAIIAVVGNNGTSQIFGNFTYGLTHNNALVVNVTPCNAAAIALMNNSGFVLAPYTQTKTNCTFGWGTGCTFATGVTYLFNFTTAPE